MISKHHFNMILTMAFHLYDYGIRDTFDQLPLTLFQL